MTSESTTKDFCQRFQIVSLLSAAAQEPSQVRDHFLADSMTGSCSVVMGKAITCGRMRLSRSKISHAACLICVTVSLHLVPGWQLVLRQVLTEQVRRWPLRGRIRLGCRADTWLTCWGRSEDLEVRGRSLDLLEVRLWRQPHGSLAFGGRQNGVVCWMSERVEVEDLHRALRVICPGQVVHDLMRHIAYNFSLQERGLKGGLKGGL